MIAMDFTPVFSYIDDKISELHSELRIEFVLKTDLAPINTALDKIIASLLRLEQEQIFTSRTLGRAELA